MTTSSNVDFAIPYPFGDNGNHGAPPKFISIEDRFEDIERRLSGLEMSFRMLVLQVEELTGEVCKLTEFYLDGDEDE